MYITDFTYNLIHPVKFANNSKQDEIEYIVLSSPSTNQLRSSRMLKQLIMRGMLEVSNKIDTKEEVKGKKQNAGIDCDAVLLMMYGSNCDVDEYFSAFERLLKTEIAKINGTNIALIPDLYNSLSPDDIDNILGEYIVNFLMPSKMKKG